MGVGVHAVVVSAAARSPWPAELERPDLVIAADAGVAHALALELPVDLVVGDLDSVDAEALARATGAGAFVEAHPAEKDATDLELALDAACREGATTITVLDAARGRLDHFLATALLLGSTRWADRCVRAFVDGARLTVVPAGSVRAIDGLVGSLVSLLAIGGPAAGVRTSGLRYALNGETLAAGSTRGVSNEIVAAPATVTIGTGTVLVVQPAPEEPA